MIIYKVLRAGEWREFEAQGHTSGAPVDLADGYIHFSTAAQLRGTLAKHFAGEDGLWLIEVEADALAADLRWEPSRGGALFPHLYSSLKRGDVTRARPLQDALTEVPTCD